MIQIHHVKLFALKKKIKRIASRSIRMPVPSASSKIIFTTFKFFWAWLIFFEHSQIFWSWSKARFYLINLHIWAWSKIFEHIQKYWTRSKIFEHGQKIFELEDGLGMIQLKDTSSIFLILHAMALSMSKPLSHYYRKYQSK